MIDRPHLFHKLAERWLALLKGHRTVFLLTMIGVPLTFVVFYMGVTGRINSEDLPAVIGALAAYATGTGWVYARSKKVTLDGDGANRHPALDDIPPPTDPEPVP